MKTLFSLCMLLLAAGAFAQDRIVKKNSDVIECNVTEIGASEIKYHYADKPKLTFGIDKALVKKVEFGTGEVVEIEANTFENSEYYTEQGKHAFKVNFLSPLIGSTELVYEHSVRPGRSWETALGIIGLGNDAADFNPRGLYGKFAWKFMKNPDHYLHRMHYAHILKGAYIAPEIAIRYTKFDEGGYYYTSPGSNGNYYHYSSERAEKFTMALMLKFGKQWVIDNGFLVDVYWGVGYGIGAESDETIPYGFLAAPNDFPIAFTSGIRIGWVFGN